MSFNNIYIYNRNNPSYVDINLDNNPKFSIDNLHLIKLCKIKSNYNCYRNSSHLGSIIICNNILGHD